MLSSSVWNSSVVCVCTSSWSSNNIINHSTGLTSLVFKTLKENVITRKKERPSASPTASLVVERESAFLIECIFVVMLDSAWQPPLAEWDSQATLAFLPLWVCVCVFSFFLWRLFFVNYVRTWCNTLLKACISDLDLSTLGIIVTIVY